MKKIIPLLCLFLGIHSAFAQVPNTESMLPKIEAEKNEDARAKLLWHTMGTSETDPVLDLEIADKLLVHSRKTHDVVEKVFAVACMGYDYRLLGNKEKSWKYSLEAMEIAEKIPSKGANAIASMGVAVNYGDIGDYNNAVKYFSRALDNTSKAKLDEMESVCLLSLGEFYLNMNKLDSALMYTQRSYETSLRIGYADYFGPQLQQLGSIHEGLGHASLAISYYNLAIKEGYKMASPKFINTSYTAIAQYYEKLNQKDSARIYAKKAIAAVQNTAFTNFSLIPAKILLDIYRGSNIDSAFKYSEIYRIANDSLFNAKTIQQTQLLAFEENVRQQQIEEEANKAKEQNKENIELALIALGIVTFIIFFLLLSRSIITNVKLIEFFGVLALLIVFEFFNLLLHPFLESKIHHSPILMLLALVCVASLLIPLHHRIEKWSTHKLVEKNKAIRLANAKKTIERLG